MSSGPAIDIDDVIGLLSDEPKKETPKEQEPKVFTPEQLSSTPKPEVIKEDPNVLLRFVLKCINKRLSLKPNTVLNGKKYHFSNNRNIYYICD
jgi:hypothetical protein